MEVKLELKHLAPYLPYGLKVNDTVNDYLVKGYEESFGYFRLKLLINTDGKSETFYKPTIKCCKPILRNLSDLTKEIEVDGEKFVPTQKYSYLRFEEISNYKGGQNVMNFIQVREQNILLELHFDIFGLIENGLAIDINKLDKND